MKKFRGASILVSLKMKLGMPVKEEGKFTYKVLSYLMDCKWYWFRNNTLVIYAFNSELVNDNVLIFSGVEDARSFLDIILATELEEMPEHKYIDLSEVETRDAAILIANKINEK